ncbi:MAG: orotidine 5'-phosphate decarboxylase [Alphaproteobacteria bacterium RIFCSPLOWO2_01_FULL_40_26]|nr:MAG: orotidine 5'-phosphate decarboxylase [Alphaproteobacteria bacterium RIFCSPHIGHO2_02_FULL_40_34]OFW88578.1 MAG: orotidine 5'-phosphate decarboxylase [Alphaproteobacteria bacterium RIFCSPHIGHO2_01_FULL_40_8]OFW94009.1 MAG: orotidine 5'-phosphate decarboxylase [Alphaproteobacteria bacterium RIFCSPLOWO2_01_FULL_40_26]OFX09544.1 MAG: orotidine 5'-phosphate decarboxylase [Alphaproteobacteria bacterium RIFCSPLOWO2_02_FULL_40_19]OFX10992.1 MAG: orotidine 5'-phosphate decarboxylase [Alphaproteob
MKDKLIVALDIPDFSAAKKLVDELGSEVSFYKIGLELMMSGEYFSLLKWLKSKGKKIFADLKLYDISETVARAVQNLAQYEIDLLTIHTANRETMEKAAQNKGKIQIIGVTILTNFDTKDLNEMGFDPSVSLEELINKKTALALSSGLDGVVASGLEAKNLRQNFGNDFLIVSPGIRAQAIANDDQKRVCDVKTSLTNGSSHLVVGRPITRATNPRTAAAQFNKLIHEALNNSFAS